MKLKKIYIALICVLLSVSAFANGDRFRENTDNWLQRAPANRPGGTDLGETPTTTPGFTENGPIGDAIPLVVALGLGYAMFIVYKRRKTVN